MTVDVLTLDDYARVAQERLDLPVWDFVEGGAGDEVTLAGNRAAFEAVRLRPSVLRAAGHPRTATTILGRTWEAPIGVAPLAFQTLVHPAGEVATAEGCAAGGFPLVLSTMSGRTFEDVAEAAAGRVPLWFQLYCFRDPEVDRALVERAEAVGVEAIVVTVDTPHLGRRLRDRRNRFRLPDGVVAANLQVPDIGSPAAHSEAEFATDLDWSVIERLHGLSSLPILVKGVMTSEDARRALAAGADGIVVSNHGGRQLDGVPATLELLPEVVAATGGRRPVLVDGGIRRGRDVLAALALGANAVLLGRPVLHGLAGAGASGVAGVLSLLVDELRDAMSLAGVRDVAAATPNLLQRPSAPPSGGEPAPTAGAIRPGRSELRLEELHASLADPVMDTMNFLNEITLRHPEAISFAPGRPFDGFFDSEQVFDQIRRYLEHLRAQGQSESGIRDAIFQYGPAAGQIRGLIAESLRADEAIDVPPEAVVVTVGAQEGIFLALRALVAGPTDALLVSSPCYVGITGAARLLDIDVTPVPERPSGFCAADVESAVLAEQARGRRVRAFYIVPDHSNPSGGTVPLEERGALLEIAARRDFLILEDSPYRLVSAGHRLPTLKALDTERRVVHLGSYSKTVFPGARLGFAVADQEWTGSDGRTGLLADAMAKIKSMVTVNTSSLSQAAVAGALLAANGRVSELNRKTSAYYADALRTTRTQLERRFPPAVRQELGVRWNEPTGGFFLSMTVPFVADNAALARCVAEHGVLWTPMSYFYPGGGGEHGIRLSVSYLTKKEIETGIDRLADFVVADAGVQVTTAMA